MTVYGSLITENMRSLGKTGHTGEAKSDINIIDNEIMDIYPDGYEQTELMIKEENTSSSIIQELGDLVVSYTYIKNRIIDYLGEEYLNSSPLADGTDSMQFYDSEIFTSNDNVVIITSYKVNPIIDFGDFLTMRMSNSYCAHLWNGYNVNGSAADDDMSKIVFITEDSEVYHVSTSCSYLCLSVKVVATSGVDEERNSNGGKYYPCLLCAINHGTPAFVYICEDGDRYHYSKKCFALKRTYSAVNLLSVIDTHRPCSRCGG